MSLSILAYRDEEGNYVDLTGNHGKKSEDRMLMEVPKWGWKPRGEASTIAQRHGTEKEEKNGTEE